MKILVTGGAGYVGSVTAEVLLSRGYDVIVVDDLRQGHRAAVPPKAELLIADICRADALDTLFRRHKIDAVIHMAAESVVGHSMTDPAKYIRNNVIGGVSLLDAMVRNNVNEIIFSSTAAVYGEPQTVPIVENHPTNPINAYGASKLMFENILAWYGRAYDIKHISFRYFNAAGATELLGEDHRPETHLIPKVLKVARGESKSVNIFGNDYPTRDGSCIRDYVHVADIAEAHICGLSNIEELNGRVYNLGSEHGYSVLEIVAAAEKMVGAKIPVSISPHRQGDPAVLVASNALAINELGWHMRFADIEDIIACTWQWMKKYPAGYRE